LFVRDSVVRDNTVNAGLVIGNDNGGGGIRWTGSGTPFEVTHSSIYGNSAIVGGTGSGGGGIYSNDAPLLENVTLSSNRHVVGVGAPAGGGGGGILVKAQGGSITHATFFGNHSDRPGGAIAGQSTTLQNSLFHANTAPTDPDCAPGAATTGGGNLSSTPFAACDFGPQDLAGGDPNLGPLAVNGSANGTFTHEILARDSEAGGDRDPVEFPTEQGVGCPLDEDQRRISRQQFGDCDSGAYEFDGRASATIPDCSPTGVIPLGLDAPPGHTVDGLSYRVGQDPAVLQENTGDSGAPVTPASVTIPEGRTTLEYWGRWDSNSTSDVPEETGHGFGNVLVDKTQPLVDVEQPQGQSIFVITRRATVNVTADDPLSGLTQDPEAAGVPIDTGSRGTASVARTAADLCENQATDSFDYRVLAPGLGIRTVLERVKGRVRVRSAGGGSGAQASQKGQPFAALSQPRELPVGSFIDARRGTARLTSARTRREDQIQDGLFTAGLFQVLQSRRVRAKGLTEVRLKGGNFRRCRTTGKRGPGAAQVRRRVIRRLNGNSRGRFRTRGRHSAATVRGTVWQVIDRCDGTLTKVKRGRVAVRDFRRKRTVIVRAGKSYLARAPR
jgi:hypothetical protein